MSDTETQAPTPLPAMAEMFPMLAAPTPAAKPAAATKVVGKITEYTLPGGIILKMVRPTNRVHRVLVEQPDQQVRFMLSTIAANCIVELTIPANYAGDDEAEITYTFDPKDIKAAHYNRFDEFSLVDTQALTAAFEELNSPTKAMVEEITGAINKAAAAKKST